MAMCRMLLRISFLILPVLKQFVSSNAAEIPKHCYPSGSVVIVLDFSTSTLNRHKETEKFIEGFARLVNPGLGKDKLDVSVVGFADKQAVLFVERNHQSAKDIMKKYWKVYNEEKGWLSGATFITYGLDKANDLLQQSVKKIIIIIISDGEMTGQAEAPLAIRKADQLKESGVLVFSIYLRVNRTKRISERYANFMRGLSYNGTYFAKLDDLNVSKPETQRFLQSLFSRICEYTYSPFLDPRTRKRSHAKNKKTQIVFHRAMILIFAIIGGLMLVACTMLAMVAVWVKQRRTKASAAGGGGDNCTKSAWNDLTAFAQTRLGHPSRAVNVNTGVTANTQTTKRGALKNVRIGAEKRQRTQGAGARHAINTHGEQVTRLPFENSPVVHKNKTAGVRRLDKTAGQQVALNSQSPRNQAAGVRRPDVSRGQAVTKAWTTKRTQW